MSLRWAVVLAVGAISEVAQAQVEAREQESVKREQHSEPAPAPVPAMATSPWRDRPFSVDAHVGIATPFGLAGVAAEYAPLPALSLGAGVGTNLFGLQLAGMARCRVTPYSKSSFYVGLGYSQGRHGQSVGTRHGLFSLFWGPLTQMGHSSPRGHEWKTAHFINVEVGGERRYQSGFDMRGYLGGALLLNADDNVTDPPTPSGDEILPVTYVMAYGGFAFGYAL